jgi:hypothetical protein
MKECLAIALLLLAARPARGAPADALQLAHCPGEGGEYLATLDDTIALDRNFLDEKLSDEANARLAIEHQLRYAWGWLRTNPAMRASTQAALSAEAPGIAIRSMKKGRYGRDLALPWTETEERLKIEDRYTVKAVARGAARADDEALVVTYQVRFKLAMCGPPRGASSTLALPLPRDPWLLYWHVPKKLHRLMRYFNETAVTNPCSDDDFADLPHPYYYWYDWQPDRNGPDADGKSFDCREILKPGVDYFAHTIALQRLGTPTGDFADLRRELSGLKGPLGATVLIGVLDHTYKEIDAAGLAAELAPGKPLARRVAAAIASPAPRERATEKFLNLLHDLPEIMQVDTHRSAAEGGFLVTTVEGKLKRSGRPVRIRAWLGLTDIFGPVPPKHWGIARRALAEDHVVIYAGHSGIGENLRLKRIEDNLKIAHDVIGQQLAKSPFQLIAFLSCYSYMYFGQDLLAAGTAAGREFVYTGTGYTKGDRGALAILDLLDQALVGGKVAPRFLDAEDFLLLKSHPPAK